MEVPPELYRPIVGFITDRQTLFNLLTTCRQLNAEAERTLYHKFEHVHNAKTQVLFLQRIVDCPRVARLVHSYRFEVDWRTNFPKEHVFWDLLPQALRATVNLKILQFRTHGGTPVARSVLSGCTFQLETLHWHCHSDEKYIQELLETQTQLRSLSLGGWDHRAFSAHRHDVEQPGLYALAGCHGVVRAFLPGRKITHLRWVPDLDDPWDDSTGLDVPALADALHELKFLKFGGYFTRPHLCTISPHLTNLIFLELMEFDKNENQSVFSLPSLKLFRISMRWGLHTISIEDPEGRAAELLAGSKSLHAVEIETETFYGDDGKSQFYSRWERDAGLVDGRLHVFEMWPAIEA